LQCNDARLALPISFLDISYIFPEYYFRFPTFSAIPDLARLT
jgi:hypothetical protein